MSTPEPVRPRGPYAKGVVRRQQILDVALDVLGEKSLENSSLDEIAGSVGITRQGLLHYFGSKENLIVAVLEERDVRDVAAGMSDHDPTASLDDNLVRSVDRTKASPGLARLYTAFAAAATDPTHPAHGFFRQRYEAIRQTTRRGLEAAIREDRIDPSIDVEVASQQILGILDGLQLQWLLDPDLDTEDALRSAVRAFLPPPSSTQPIRGQRRRHV